MNYALRCFTSLGVVAVSTTLLFAEDLRVLPKQSEAGSTDQALTRLLKRRVDEALRRRMKAFLALETAEDVADYQQRKRAEMIRRLGGFPDRTPLKPRVVESLDADGYRIEKVIFESQPGHLVTANLYLPDGEGPFPGVVIPSGHSRSAKAAGYNQQAAVVLARFGIAALPYDPIGQGERAQFLDADGKPRFGTTTEHTLLGAGCIPLGLNTATFRIWDGMRALDYLASRPEIDAQRLGVTGCSGGGTLTSYLMALDDRVACAAPSCYLTSFGRLTDTIGPQDAEQNIFGQIQAGIDHADYVLMRAPKPTLILAATHDFFDISGTWDTFRQAKQTYTRLGFAERVDLVETDTKHGFPQPQRLAMLRWMRRWLSGVDEPTREPDLKVLAEAKLLCTEQGQTLRVDGARSAVDLNTETENRLRVERKKLWEQTPRPELLERIGQLAGIRPPKELPRPEVQTVDSIQRGDYKIEKLIMQRPAGVDLPALLFRPQKETGRRYLYLHGQGKHADAAADGPIAKLVRAGSVVLAVDLSGMGETGLAGENRWGARWDDFFLAYLLGQSLVGIRAEDALIAARYLAEADHAPSPKPVHLIAVGVAAPPALHAAALHPDLFAQLTLRKALPSWADLVRHPDAPGQLASTVHRALHVYDLPDLLRLISAQGKDKVNVVEPLRLASSNE